MTDRAGPGVGETFGGYTIDSLLGRGGMGAVYLATHERLARKVALKLISPELAYDEDFRARFLRESQLAASLEHPNVIPIYDADEIDGVLFLAMRYVDGPSLQALLRTRGTLPPEETLNVTEQIGGALDAAHEAGLVHRDVKPANILIAEPGKHAYLCDFGLARHTSSQGMTRTGFFLGSIDYCAPEQIQGTPVDGRADVYSLGCVVFHCLVGKPPYRRETEFAVLNAHINDPPPAVSTLRPDLPKAIDGVIVTAMAKHRDVRFATAGELAHALRAALSEEEPADDATRVAPTRWQDHAPTVAVAGPPGRRRKWIAAVAILAALAAAAALAAFLALRSSGTEATPPADTAIRTFVAKIEPILEQSATARRSIGNTLSRGFNCEISASETRKRLDTVVRERRRVLARVSGITGVPADAEKARRRLETALNESIEADVLYRSGFGNATGCPQQSDYFDEAAKADARATKAKKRFVAAFNPLAGRVGLTRWSASEI